LAASAAASSASWSAIDARDTAQHLAGKVAGVGWIGDQLRAQETVGDLAVRSVNRARPP